MKGLLLAGGRGTRLHPATRALSKQLLPVYDTPMIYFPLATLIGAGVREILIITTPEDRFAFERLLGDGGQWGLALDYASQPVPRGIADALLIGEAFLAGGPCVLMLGDNILDAPAPPRALSEIRDLKSGATIFAKPVADPSAYGVVTLDAAGQPISIEEKPDRPRSALAVIGLYAYDATAPERARQLRPSSRGELEITDLNCGYLADGALTVATLNDGVTWLDAGTPDALTEASAYVQAAANGDRRPGCVEEAAFRQGWIDAAQLARLAADGGDGAYARYLRALVDRSHELIPPADHPAPPPSPRSRPAPDPRSTR